MPPQAMERLQRLKDKTEAASYAEVIRNALRVFEALVTEHEGGAEFFLGQSQVIFEMPEPGVGIPRRHPQLGHRFADHFGSFLMRQQPPKRCRLGSSPSSLGLAYSILPSDATTSSKLYLLYARQAQLF